ncbi:MAG: hypothetical protein NVSMB42_17870 [Herpetosiphon sp.]
MTPKATRQYLIEFGSAMLGYTVAVLVSISLIKQFPTSAWRYPLALLPMVPAVLAMWAFVRAIGRMDELQRRIQFDSIVFASGATAMLTFGYGWLENVGLPHLPLLYVLPLMTALWGFGTAVNNWRYR